MRIVMIYRKNSRNELHAVGRVVAMELFTVELFTVLACLNQVRNHFNIVLL